MILLVLGVAIYTKEKEPPCIRTQSENTSSLNRDKESEKNHKRKKAKVVPVRPGWRAPKSVQVDILNPVEFDPNKGVNETSSIQITQ